MRRLLSGVACFICLSGPGAAVADKPSVCLSSGDAQEAVAGRKVVAPGVAISVARQAVPNSDVLRAALCREPDELIYFVTSLRKDGRLMRISIDAHSGKLKTVH